MKSVERLAYTTLQAQGHVDILMHSAGIHDYKRRLTREGTEYNFAVNYLSRFHLTNLLMEALRTGQQSRVVVVGSPYVFDPKRFLTFSGLQGTPTRPLIALLKAGMAISVWTVELARRLKTQGVSVVNMIPGIVQTDILRNDPWFIKAMDKVLQPLQGMSAERAGRHYAEVATKPLDALFYKNTQRSFVPTKVPKETYSQTLGERLWNFSEKLVETSVQ